jgi:hypothetical protein
MFNDDIQFELVREEEVPYHECGHYHATTLPCPEPRTCTSKLCCVAAGKLDEDE